MRTKLSSWELARRNFIQIAFLVLIICIVLLGLYLADNDTVHSTVTLFSLSAMFASCIAWFYLATLYKRKDPRATVISFLFLALLLIANVLGGNLSVFLVLIFGYLFYIVYKAHADGPSLSATDGLTVQPDAPDRPLPPPER